MAELMDYVDEMIKCPICLDEVKDPKSLPCLHTFCFECINTHCRDACPGDEVNCPVCRTNFQIPQKGVEELTSNFFVKNLAEAKSVSGKSKAKELCNQCLSCGETSARTASAFCANCGWKLCERCKGSHKQIPGEHDVVEFGVDASQKMMKAKATFCQHHRGRPVDLYCVECKTNICLVCYHGKHKKHDCSDINEIYQEFQKKIEEDVKLASSKEERVAREVKHLDAQHQAFVDSVE